MTEEMTRPGDGVLMVEFLDRKHRAVVQDGQVWLVAVDVAETLGAAVVVGGDDTRNGSHFVRSVPPEEKGVHSVSPSESVGKMWCVTTAGALCMALARRRLMPAELREKLDAMLVAATTAATTAPPNPAVMAQMAALRQEIATLTALVRAIPAPNVEDVARAVAVALETWEAGKYKRRSDAIKAGHARAVAAGWDPRKPVTPKRPVVTEADVLAALRAELGPVGADNLARRHGWGRQAVREMLLAMEKAGRVEFGRHGPKGQGWRVRPEVV